MAYTNDLFYDEILNLNFFWFFIKIELASEKKFLHDDAGGYCNTMNYMDYREKLGIGFSDDEKFKYLKTNILTCLRYFQNSYNMRSYCQFCLSIGYPCAPPPESYSKSEEIKWYLDEILNILKTKNSIKEFLWYIIAFLNTISEDSANNSDDTSLKEGLKNLIIREMNRAKIPFDIFEYSDGYFIFPKGAKELDDVLISEPMEWLGSYPKSRKDFVKALKQYYNSEDYSDVADNFRKALETFFKEFFNNDKNLKNNIDYFGDFLKRHGAIKEVSNTFMKMLDLYDKFNNKTSKHNNNINKDFLEYVMYGTFNFVRLLLTLDKEAETEDK